ncbi:MAG: nitrous oxide-stimulated promoter family protein [Chloroflexota bacterium]|nr:nitrous oxide-stimulated promoter family protein [Chloroflexota bacterium]
MPGIFQTIDPKRDKDIRILSDFIAIYCRENHKTVPREQFPIRDDSLHTILGDKELLLCEDCSKLLNHGIAKLLICPYNPKPACRKCPTHCYAPGYREHVRKVMRFSGTYLVKRGRLDLLLHFIH